MQAVVYSEDVTRYKGELALQVLKCHHHLHECGIIEVMPYSANVPHMQVHAADNVSHMSGEGHFCIKALESHSGHILSD